MSKLVLSCLIALAAMVAAPSYAGTLTVKVVSDGGKPVANAVVTLKPVGQAAPAPRAGGPYRVEQYNLQFAPFLSIVPVNAEVSFPNLDAVKHHVYSFSAAKKFELKLFAREQASGVRFDKAGAVAVGCNIHDSMVAYIFVTDTVWTARTDTNGVATFQDAPVGATVAAVWHPYLRAPGGSMSRQIALTAGRGAEVFAVRLRPPPVRGVDNY